MKVGMLKTEWKEVDLTQKELMKAIKQGWNPRFIDGLTVLGQCDVCFIPILENESYQEDREGGMQCSKHIQLKKTAMAAGKIFNIQLKETNREAEHQEH